MALTNNNIKDITKRPLKNRVALLTGTHEKAKKIRKVYTFLFEVP